jgi:hypothetical protein
MGDESGWHLPSGSTQDPMRETVDGYVAHPKSYIEEATNDRAILCDCHCGPMYYFPVSLKSTSDFAMCWVSDCGRCYNKSLGYFRLRATRPTLSRIDEASRRIAPCPNQNCPTSSSMAVTRLNGASGSKDETRWHCFDCGGELPFHNDNLWKRLMRSLGPSAHRRPLVKH